MNPETPKFESKTIKTFSIPEGAKMLVFEQTFYNEMPSVVGENMPETDIPVAPPVSIPEESKKLDEPTESQLFWRKMLQTEDSPYDLKKKEPMKFDALKGSIHELFTNPKEYWKNRNEWVKTIDKELRGGRELDSLDVRMQRVFVLGLTAGLFSAFDQATGKWVIDPGFKKFFGEDWKADKTMKGVYLRGVRKLIEVLNDKYASDLSNFGADKLTGKRVGFVHEFPDKANDMITAGFSEELADKVNGTVLESLLRISYQFPIFGALSEQMFSRITAFQEKSAFHKDTAKAFFSAAGIIIGGWRELQTLPGENS